MRALAHRAARSTDVASGSGCRAGIGTNTVSKLETGRNVGFENLIRVAMVLGRRKELEALFLPKVECIADITCYELGAKRQRIRKKSGQD